ncbi:hypothetical protein B5S50_10965 [Clostridium sp. 001]|nr:hypothetical protein B5S50_10965 [Clostridium sp. 001]
MILSKKDLGLLIKAARKYKSEKIQRSYTQKMLANDIQKSQSHIGDIESGRTYPSFMILNKIAEACEVPMSFFESDTDRTFKVPTVQNLTLKESINFMMHQNSIIDFCSIDIKKLNKPEQHSLIEDILNQLKLISYKYRK